MPSDELNQKLRQKSVSQESLTVAVSIKLATLLSPYPSPTKERGELSQRQMSQIISFEGQLNK